MFLQFSASLPIGLPRVASSLAKQLFICGDVKDIIDYLERYAEIFGIYSRRFELFIVGSGGDAAELARASYKLARLEDIDTAQIIDRNSLVFVFKILHLTRYHSGTARRTRKKRNGLCNGIGGDIFCFACGLECESQQRIAGKERVCLAEFDMA